MTATNCVHRIAPSDSASSQTVAALLDELKGIAVESRTPFGRAMAFVVSSWRREADGSFLVQFSPLVAARLNALQLSGIELLRSARRLAAETHAPA